MRKTGPITKPGKAASSRNAVKYGISSPSPVILEIGEDPKEWERHRLGTIESLDPEGHFEIVVAERIALLVWRLKRLERFETEMTVVRLNRLPDDMVHTAIYAEKARGIPQAKSLTLEAIDDQISLRLLPADDVLATIMRFEAHLHRQWLQTQHELEAIQTRRLGGASPLARLDITGAPGG